MHRSLGVTRFQSFAWLSFSTVCLVGCTTGCTKAPAERPDFGKAESLSDVSIGDELRFEREVTGQFTEDDQFFGFPFAAVPGSVVSIELARRGSSSRLDSSLFIFEKRGDTEWNEIAFDDESGWGQLSRLRDVSLTEAVDYLAVVGTVDGAGRGDFRLTLVCEGAQVCALPALDLSRRVPSQWRAPLAEHRAADSFAALRQYLRRQVVTETVYPEPQDYFRALALAAPDQVEVVILGQDPYHGPGEAHGLAFSVSDEIAVPPSLRNIYKELETDLGIAPAPSGNLTAWAERGVLLLNTVLTVRDSEPAAHKGQGWEPFTEGIIDTLNNADRPIVFLLWGSHARAFAPRIDTDKHVVLEAAHPSPLSASNGFFGSRPFSKANDALESFGRAPIDWSLE